MLETYKGIFINIGYQITVETRLYNNQLMSNEIEFYVQVAQAGRDAIDGPYVFPKVKYFMITNE
jgi:hypothetical protein